MYNHGLFVWLMLNIYWTTAQGNIEQIDRYKSTREYVPPGFSSEPSSPASDGKGKFSLKIM